MDASVPELQPPFEPRAKNGMVQKRPVLGNTGDLNSRAFSCVIQQVSNHAGVSHRTDYSVDML
jgi:hypothetical protein